ncbi:hypothetical protein CKAH01_08296 [Colletotrichum kahawae]|uniref:Uncharacterized protein n=1 Tax=Colletotrichum kahawae TaxID=34407 RepID=A0AAE0D096_COLKA|nr:hypothetical protein CKAH01_08296 [Colletotrichum kahawae]
MGDPGTQLRALFLTVSELDWEPKPCRWSLECWTTQSEYTTQAQAPSGKNPPAPATFGPERSTPMTTEHLVGELGFLFPTAVGLGTYPMSN